MPRFAFGLVAVLITSSAFAAPQYEVTNLTEAFYADYDGSVAIENLMISCMNNVGQFAGTCTNTNGIQDAFLWEPGLAPNWLGMNVDVTNRAEPFAIFLDAINDAGQVAGDSDINTGLSDYAFRWSLDFGMKYLNLNGPYNTFRTETIGMSASGDVLFAALSRDDPSTGFRTFRWNNEAGLAEVGQDIPGLESSQPIAINDLGQMICWFDTDEDETSGFFELSPSQEIVRLGEVFPETLGMNNAGQVLSYGQIELERIDGSDDTYWSRFGFLWQDGQEVWLNDPEEQDISWSSLNNNGEVVGCLHGMEEYVGTGGSVSGAIYWSEEAGVIFLGDTLDAAGITSKAGPMEINDAGEILLDSSGGYWLASPVPEPNVLALLFTSGLLFLLRYTKARN